jgi:hypothetical protein
MQAHHSRILPDLLVVATGIAHGKNLCDASGDRIRKDQDQYLQQSTYDIV